MDSRPVILVRWAVGLLLAGLLIGLVGIAGLTQVAERTGRSVFVIHGSSMRPALPLGALVVVEPVDPLTVRAGDVLSVQTDRGLVYTHRVVEVIGPAEDLSFRTRGDANADPDPVAAPAASVVGRVVLSLPVVGFVVALLGITSGLISLVSLLGTLLLLYWLLQDLEGQAAKDAVRARLPDPREQMSG